MKKTAAAALAAALVLTTSAALAAPVEFDGDVKAHYRWNDVKSGTDTEGGKFTVRLNAKAEIAEHISAYARFATQTLSADHTGADFDTSGGRSNIARLDQYGFIYNNADWNYKIGRQSVAITPAASLISSGAYIGEDMYFLNGVVAKGKLGATSLQLVAGNVDVAGSNSDAVYSVHASYNPAEKWTVGGTLARYNEKGENTRNFWGIDAGYTIGKASFLVDYLNSNSSSDDAARVLGVDYAFDAKNTFSVYNHRTEGNGHIMTDWDHNEKGFYYIYNYDFDKATSLTLMYKDNENLDGTGDYNSFRTTVTYKF